MALKADHSNLPTAGPQAATDGRTPDRHPRFIGVLADAWADQLDDDKPTALGTRFRHSDAGKCARAIAYTAAGIPKSDPMDLAGVWNVSLGTLLHEAWQAALLERYPGAVIEVKVRTPGDVDGSGHIDALITWDDSDAVPDHARGPAWSPGADYRIAYELKSIGGFGFKGSIGRARKGTPAEGPKGEHILQAALGGLAQDADEIVIGYLAKECLSKSYRVDRELDRFAAEWTFTRDQFEPLARKEAERVQGILDLLDGDEPALARRILPGVPGEVVDPKSGRWERTDPGGRVEDTGTTWHCGYCAYQTLCIEVGPGRVPVSTAVEIAKPNQPKEAA